MAWSSGVNSPNRGCALDIREPEFYNESMSQRVSRASDNALSKKRPRADARRGRVRRRIKTFLSLVFLTVLTLVALGLTVSLMVFWNYSRRLPSVSDLAVDIRPPVATTIWSEDGVLLGSLEVENRQPVALTDISKHLTDATIAIEDHRFYEHGGIDPQGIARAVWANFRGNSLTRQGGSTLTQQLVRNLDQFGLSKEKRIERKVQEWMIAMRVEQLYSKNEILQLYLNNIYYGGGAYGIQAASKTFFGKPASGLSIGEAALLAGLPQRPLAYSPYENRDAAIKRRDEVLGRMLAYGYITQEQYDKASAENPHILPRRKQQNFSFKAPYFTTYVINDLAQRYGSDFVYSGLHVTTTLNWKMQQIAEKVLADGLSSNGSGANQGALISLDPHTGYIRAMVGGRSFHADQYNAVTQGRRQPGSTFKLFDYTAAFDTGTASLTKAYKDVPIPYPNDPKHRVVHNFGGDYSYRFIDCLSAIKFSKNTIAVQVARDVGINTVIDYAHKMGITTKLQAVLPTALGASAVRPIDLCSAYSMFSQKDGRFLPMAIIKVTDAEENLIEEHLPEIKKGFLKPETIQQIDTALEAVVTGGSGTKARGDEATGIVENARGKTGTTNDSRDAWFAGYTPELSTVIWVASVHRNGRFKRYAEMPGATGGVLCAPLWHTFMIQAVPIQRKFKLTQQIADADAVPKPVKVADDVPKPKKIKSAAKPGDAARDAVAGTGESPPDEDAGAETVDENGNPVNPTVSAPPADGADAHADPDASPTRSLTPSPIGEDKGLRSTAPTSLHPGAAAPAPATRRASSDLVAVTVCVDSGDLANSYCDATKTIRVTARQARRMHRCRLHRPPPGEE